jgi:hypothetical protein
MKISNYYLVVFTIKSVRRYSPLRKQCVFVVAYTVCYNCGRYCMAI